MKEGLKTWLAFAAVYIIWGTTYLAIKIGLGSIPPFLMASFRYSIAGVLLLIYCLIKGESVFSKNALRNVWIGAFMMTAGQAIVFWSEKYISSGLSSVFGSSLPICFIIADTRNWKNYKASKLTLFSIMLGLAGILVLFLRPAGSVQDSGLMSIFASVMAVLSCFCWAIGSLYYKYHIKTGSLYANIGWQLIGGMISCTLVGTVLGEWRGFSFTAITISGWLAVLYLSIAGSIIALTALYWLLARRPAPVVGTYAYVNPIIAVILGYFIAGEKITLLQILGMVIILVAAYLANSVKFKTASGE